MPKSFSFSEFMNTTALIRAKNFTIDSAGGVSKAPATKGTFKCQFLPISGTKKEFSGSPAIEATHYALTETKGLPVVNGDCLVVDGRAYEVLDIQQPTAFIGSYAIYYLKIINE